MVGTGNISHNNDNFIFVNNWDLYSFNILDRKL